MDSAEAIPDPDEKRWHVKVGGKKLGPFSDEEMGQLAATRRIRAKTMAWRSGLQGWLPCASIPELVHFFYSNSPGEASDPKFGTPSFSILPMIQQARDALASIDQGIRPTLKNAIGRLRVRHIVFATLILVSVAGVWGWHTYLYVPPHDDLLSIFTSEAGDQTNEIAKIEKLDRTYFLSAKNDQGQWLPGVPVHKMGKKEFAELFGQNWKDAKPLGLVGTDGKAAVLRVRPEWTNGEFTSPTGYFIMTSSGPLTVRKAELRTLSLPSLIRKSPTPTSQATETPTDTPSSTPTEFSPSATESPTTTATSTASPSPVPADSSAGAPILGNAIPDGTEPVVTVAQIDEARRRAYAARSELSGIPTSGRTAKWEVLLLGGNELLDSSQEAERTGAKKLALSYAQEALRAFEEGRTALAAAKRTPSPVPTDADETLFSAVEPSKTAYAEGDVVGVRVEIQNLRKRMRLRRVSTLKILRGDAYVPFGKPESLIFMLNPPGGTTSFAYPVDRSTPRLPYRLHIALQDIEKSDKIVFEHDFDFQVGAPQRETARPERPVQMDPDDAGAAVGAGIQLGLEIIKRLR